MAPSKELGIFVSLSAIFTAVARTCFLPNPQIPVQSTLLDPDSLT